MKQSFQYNNWDVVEAPRIVTDYESTEPWSGEDEREVELGPEYRLDHGGQARFII